MTTIYEQVILDFVLRARIKISELSEAVCKDQLCDCKRRLTGDLWAALKTLSNPASRLTTQQKLHLVEAVTALSELENIKPLSSARGLIVRQGGDGVGLEVKGALTRIMVMEGEVSTLQQAIELIASAKSEFVYIYGGDPDTFIE
jgi:hypothetical protein